MTEPAQSNAFIQQTAQTTDITELSTFSKKPDLTGGRHIMKVKSFEPSNKPMKFFKDVYELPWAQNSPDSMNESVGQALTDGGLNEGDEGKESNEIGREGLACMTTDQLNNYARFIEYFLELYAYMYM
ncbi:4549_t:CDS:2 [Paraglomus occultum]|uniref:4549_t:CDS:1 n=1 Tax=Paraglomus occultum TaxID=144539 RepID=A0A9N9D8E0_9GLOM|nr:4549_t:CDS:2 [Paraglomus occultum]